MKRSHASGPSVPHSNARHARPWRNGLKASDARQALIGARSTSFNPFKCKLFKKGAGRPIRQPASRLALEHFLQWPRVHLVHFVGKCSRMGPAGACFSSSNRDSPGPNDVADNGARSRKCIWHRPFLTSKWGKTAKFVANTTRCIRFRSSKVKKRLCDEKELPYPILT